MSARAFTTLASLSVASILVACGGSEAPPPATPSAASSPSTVAAPAAPSTSASVAAAPPPAAAAEPAPAPVAAAPAPSASTSPAPAAAVAPGDIVGTVTLPGGKPGRWSVVYLEDAPKEPGKLESAYMDNQSMQFLPPTVVVTTGGKVTFHNSDPFPHNIFSLAPVKFDLGLIPKGVGKAHTFETAGAYTILCNLHPAMVGYVVTIPSTVYAQADDKGKFRIKGAPGGSWHLNAWAPRMKTAPIAVKVDGGPVEVSVTMTKE
jgi:plastocyanin